MDVLCFVFAYIFSVYFFFKISALTDTITPSQPIGNSMTLVSKDGGFEMGLFSPAESKKQYLGIWYKNIQDKTVVWVANRETPIEDPPGTLMINSTGHLVLLNQNGTVVWSSNSSMEAKNPLAQLLDSGNFVVRDLSYGNSGTYLWQSFDYPSDTLLPDMKFGWDLRIGLDRRLTSWKSSDDPSPGDLIWEMEIHNYAEGMMWKGSRKYFRSGPWIGQRFSGNPQLRPNPIFNYTFVANQEELYYMYQLKNKSLITRIVMNQTTYTRQRFVWLEDDQAWKLYAEAPQDYCDHYGLCGANGVCSSSNSPVCQCLEGFKPKLPDKWYAMDWSHGCILEKPLNCQSTYDGFVKFTALKLPDRTFSWLNRSMNLNECREKCLKNCSCTAYSNSDIRGEGSGCAIWFGDLVDIKQFPADGQDLYIRISVSSSDARHRSTVTIIVVVLVVIATITAILTVGIGYYTCRAKPNSIDENREAENDREGLEGDVDVPSFDLVVLAAATENFSMGKKLGEGGFGPVYMGILANGQEIAVKRLSQSSGQGLNEFKNEVALIAKLQHRNLVKLIGYCIQGEEKILIYEYMPNGSLASFLFDETRSILLDWSKRFPIICGIARGLLYLHQDSRLRIIHRDLKASNVLLDKELNPKISDFGLARTFGEQNHEENTKRVVGTYGYMAPEYAIYGIFSVKSDVFSLGIILLEIVTGKKNAGFHHPDDNSNLIGHVWELWTEGRSEELMDTIIKDSFNLSEVLRCIQVGLLCVQNRPEDRPDMLSVVLMLSGEGTLPEPKLPGFLIDIKPNEASYSSSSKPEFNSANEMTVSLLDGR